MVGYPPIGDLTSTLTGGVCVSAEPQAEQNRASSMFDLPHTRHVIMTHTYKSEIREVGAFLHAAQLPRPRCMLPRGQERQYQCKLALRLALELTPVILRCYSQ
jgi:hypothetical protein